MKDFGHYGNSFMLPGRYELQREAQAWRAQAAGRELVQVHWAIGDGQIWGFESETEALVKLAEFAAHPDAERREDGTHGTPCTHFVDLTAPGCHQSYARIIPPGVFGR